MEQRIVEFSNVLRRNGVRVSLSENIDAFRALDVIGIEDPSSFRSALRATLVKRSMDLKSFDELFDIFFLGLGGELDDSERKLMAEMSLTPAEFQKMLDEIRNLMTNMEMSELARALLSGDLGQMERLLRDAAAKEMLSGIERDLRMTPYSRITARLDLESVHAELERFRAALASHEGDADDRRERLFQYLDQRLKGLHRLLREMLRREQQKGGMDLAERQQPDYFSEKSFAYYTEEDIRRMNDVVARLAQRFKNRLSVKRKRASKGRFDIKSTLRTNLQFGGVPFQIQLDRRKKEKPEVIILCDISDSVLNASRFMLQFVYSVQDLYSKVRSFVFVSEIGEVTRLFEENQIHRAIDTALKGEIINVYTHSNFGRAFELFYQGYQSAVTGKTTILVIGDGRNNYNRTNDWVLKELRQKAKQLIWLNPESRLTWGVGDSEMPAYAAYCDVLEECRNIKQLHNLIDRIVP
jgi:uncharacterized protein